MTSVIWSISSLAYVVRLVDRSISLSASVWFLMSSFLINHFELFGLEQGWLKFQGKSKPETHFQTPLLYRFVRHPLYLGLLIAFWSTSYMTAGHLLFSGVWSVYILVAIGYEERDLMEYLGEPYKDYMKKVPMIIPIGGRK